MDSDRNVPVMGSLDGLSTWIILSMSGWVSLTAAVGWIVALFAGPVGPFFDALQQPGAPTAYLVDGALTLVFALALVVPVAAALVPAASWYRRLPTRTRRVITGIWIVWVALGTSGWALAFATDSPGLDFFLIEVVVVFCVGLFILALLAAVGASLHARAGRTPLWRAQERYRADGES